MIDPAQRNIVGRTQVSVSALGVGTASLGNVFGSVDDDAAYDLMAEAAKAGLGYVDTAPLYGNGLSETRLGDALWQLGQPQFSLSTKVGRVLDPDAAQGWRFDFSRDGIFRSLASSLDRLGRDRVDIVYLHDPDDHELDVYAHAWPALESLRDQGVIGALGVGMNQWQMPLRLIDRLDLDVVMLAGRYTLLDRSAGQEFLPSCAERGVGVVLAGVFNSGVLIDPGAGAWYDYRPASEDILARARLFRNIAQRHGFTLPQLALQFAFNAPAVVSVVVGVGSAHTLRANLDAVRTPVTSELWEELSEADAGRS